MVAVLPTATTGNPIHPPRERPIAMTAHGPDQRRRVGNALTDAGILTPPALIDVLITAVTAHPGERDVAIVYVLTHVDGLEWREAARLIDLTSEALEEPTA